MALIVTKFGGTSVANTDKIKDAAAKVAREVAAGHQVVVVVSAMSGVTNQLVGYCNDMSNTQGSEEYDVVVSSGEQVTSGLMAMALEEMGVNARSWMGWQIPIRTCNTHGSAVIEGIDSDTLQDTLKRREVIVVPGFQGLTNKNRISTLGRGGSDTTAVALAAALKADRCDIYTDVDGVYTADPRIVPKAQKLSRISCEEMIELASLGAKVLQTRSVEVAMKNDINVQVLSSFEDHIGSDLPGTLIVREDNTMETKVVSGVAHQADEAKVTLLDVPDLPGLAAKVFDPLADAGVNVDMIVQNISSDGKATDMTFTCSHNDLPKAVKALEECPDLKGIKLTTSTEMAKVSVVGVGMITNHGIASKMFKTLAEKNINIGVISTSEIKISVLVERDYMELAVRALHEAFGLDAE